MRAKTENVRIMHSQKPAEFFGMHHYKIIEAALSGRLEVFTLLGPDNQKYVFKKGNKLGATQLALLRFATEKKWDKGCRLPTLIREGKVNEALYKHATWALMQNVPGESIEALIQSLTNAQVCIDATWQAALGYQDLLAAFMLEQPQYCNEGMNWIHERVGTQGDKSWSLPIVQAGLVSANTIEEINTAWAQMAAKYQAKLFVTVHGNIHGNHTFKCGQDIYIVDPQCWWRPFPGEIDAKIRGALYDWIRALDWMIMRCAYPAQMMKNILKNIFRKTRKYGIPDEEIRIFLAMRGIGGLGADILKGMDSLEHDEYLEVRKECLVRLIKGAY